ncbi:MAG: UvrD-helicase domain-containing protein [Fimbriimonas sp.]
MSRPTPSEEQQRVIESTAPDLVIRASAGVGKTFVLVERYLRLVQEDRISPDHILAITFTRKAAGEMKARIVRRLREAGLREEARIAETGPVQTIHSFCERLLRENAIEAGIDPEFEVLEDANAVMMRCARAALAAPRDEVPHLADLLAHLAKKRNQESAEQDLQSWVRDAVDRLRGAGIPRADFALHSVDPGTLELRWQEALVADMSPQWQEFFTSTTGEFVDRLADVAHEFRKRPTGVNHKSYPAVLECLPALAGFGQLVVKTWELFDERLSDLNALDFGGLELRAVQMAERGQLRDMPYQVMLVDEAQDVNPLQYRLIKALGSPHQLLVGDEKQSIYGFRHAAPHLFLERAEQGTDLSLSINRRSEEQGILRFADAVFGREWDTYRPMAQTGPLDLEKDPSLDVSGVEAWQLTAEDWIAETTLYTQALVQEGAAPGEIAILVRTRDQAVQIKDSLARRKLQAIIMGGSDRYYARLEIRDLSNALRALSDPSDKFALLSLLRSPMVGTSLDLVVLLAAQEDDPLEFLRQIPSPVAEDHAKVVQFLKWFEPLAACTDRMSAAEALSFVIADSPLMVELAKRSDSSQRIANVRKLLRLASRDPEVSPREFAEKVREIQSLRHDEGDAPAHEDENHCIKIMTIHKAKGLEFPITIVPCTQDKFGEIRNQRLLGELKWGLFGFPQLAKAYLDWMRGHEQVRGRQEQMRLLYVALTRSQRRLCVGLFPKNQTNTPSQLLRKVLEEPGVSGLRQRDISAAEVS